MRKCFYILFLAVVPLIARAQFDTQLSNYWAATNYFNPAYAGESGKLELTGLYRMQWLGVTNAPQTGVILGERPFLFMNREHGVGVSMYNDRIGLFTSSVISGQYAFKLRMPGGGRFSIGLQGGYINQSFDGSKVILPADDPDFDPNDPAIPKSNISGNSIDLAAGIYYTDSLRRWYVGLSATHLLAPSLELSENYILDIPRSYYFTAGYNIALNNPLLELRPSIWVKASEPGSLYVDEDSLKTAYHPNTFKAMLQQTQVDVSLRLVYNKAWWAGLSWRKGESMILMLGGKFKSM
jgi:type IX secretion system PorP/SprF family membrane protein